MALQQIRIGDAIDVYQYDDATVPHTSGIDCTAPISAASPVNVRDVVTLSDLPTLANILSASAVIVDHTIVRGHGGARIVQDSGITIDDTDNLTLPAGAVYSSNAADATHYFGHAVIGWIGSGNEAALQHVDLALNGLNYAIQQLNLGTTYVNCVAGQELHFCRNDVSLATLTELESLVDNSMVDTLHRHSELSASDGAPDACILIGATGALTLVDTARVYKSEWIDAGAIRAPGTKPATSQPHGLLEVSVWSFADQAVAGNQETVSVVIQVPADMDRTVAPILCVGWSTAGGSAGVCEWSFEYLYTAEGEDTGAAGQDTETMNEASPITGDGLVVTLTGALDLPGATDICLHGQLKRLSAGGTDTIAASVELHGVSLRYVSNKLGEPT